MARAPKIDAVLGAEAGLARRTLQGTVETAWIGEHLGVAADDDRVLTHRFEAKLPGYAGWNWYVTLARVPRGKVVTVCETGLLPGEGAIVAPEWVPWADRVLPEELQAHQAAEAAEAAAASGVDAGGKEAAQAQQHDGGTPVAVQEDQSGSAGENLDAATDQDKHEAAGDGDAEGEQPQAEQTGPTAGRSPQRSRSRRRRR